ncbi:MAG TPA: hypothetical protein VJJ27_01865 [Candidatus Paceibacterota bacterium]
MKKIVYKRIFTFLAVLLVSFFMPWQMTAVLLLAAALFMPIPIEYVFLLVGFFGVGIFSYIWLVFVFLGLFLRQRTRFNFFSPKDTRALRM